MTKKPFPCFQETVDTLCALRDGNEIQKKKYKEVMDIYIAPTLLQDALLNSRHTYWLTEEAYDELTELRSYL